MLEGVESNLMDIPEIVASHPQYYPLTLAHQELVAKIVSNPNRILKETGVNCPYEQND